jgi:type II secretory pathway pseudopilin PulG
MDRIVLHRKTSIRKYRQRLSTLFVVVGSLCILIGAAIALSALTRLEYEQPRFFRLGSYFAFGGLVFVILHLLFFTLPDYMEKRRSGVVIRRKALSKSYHRPKPGQVATHTGEGGSILILVLVLLGILSALSLQVIVSARSAAAESSATMNMELLKLAAIDATRTAMQELANDIDLTTDHLNESWAINQEYEDPSGISRLIRVIDAERSFDLNNISVPITGSLLPPSEVLANILILCGDFRPGEKLDNLRDWVDTDTTGPRESRGRPHPVRVGGIVSCGRLERVHV